MADTWEDLSDDELAARLIARGAPESLAAHAVSRRDNPATIDWITRRLDE